MPRKIHWSWVSEVKTAAKKSKYHERGAKYRVSTTMDAEYFKNEFRIIGKKIRAEYAKRGENYAAREASDRFGRQPRHGARPWQLRGAKAMIDRDLNIHLVQQVGNTPAFNISDLVIWRSCEAEVDKMPQALRYREDELFKVREKAWKKNPLHKILIAFEMRKDCARECIATGGDIDREARTTAKPESGPTRPLNTRPCARS